MKNKKIKSSGKKPLRKTFRFKAGKIILKNLLKKSADMIIKKRDILQ